MNLKTYAAHRKAHGLRGGTHVSVLRAISSGRLFSPAVDQVDGRWFIDPALADQQWASNTGQGSGSVWPPAAAPPPAPATTAPRAVAPPAAALPQQMLGGKAQAEAVRTMYQAKLLELDFKKRQKELLPKEDVDRVRFEEVRRARDAFRRLPLLMIGDVAATAGGLTQEQRAEMLILLERHIVNVLEELGEED